MIALIVTDKDYVLEHYKKLQFDCKDNVQKVRNYLEQECGFKKAQWDTERYLNLEWLKINANGYVHGSYDPYDYSYQPCDIYYLIDTVVTISSGCKPMKLKE